MATAKRLQRRANFISTAFWECGQRVEAESSGNPGPTSPQTHSTPRKRRLCSENNCRKCSGANPRTDRIFYSSGLLRSVAELTERRASRMSHWKLSSFLKCWHNSRLTQFLFSFQSGGSIFTRK